MGIDLLTKGRRRSFLRVLVFILAWSPAVITGSLMARYAVDIPVWDDLERAELLDRYQSGTLDWTFLSSAHIEHRILLPRLIILANATFADGSLRNEVAVNFVAMLISALCCAWLVRKTRPGQRSNPLLIFLINLSVFSLIQYQNLCWAIQTAFFLPLTFMALTLVIQRSSLRWPVQFALSLLCALGGTLSFSHGLVLWPLVAVWLLVAANNWTVKKRLLIAGAWLLVAAIVGFLYFNGISSTSHPAHSYLQDPGEYPPGFSDVVGGKLNPLHVVYAFFLALGSPFCRVILIDPLTVAPWIGIVLLAGFAALTLVSIWRCIATRSKEEWRSVLPWIAMGGYAVASIFLVSLGRAGFGVARVLSPRYLTITNYLIVSMVVLAAMNFSTEVLRTRMRGVALIVLGLLLALQGWNWIYGYRGLQLWHAARWQSLNGYLFREFGASEHPNRLDYTPDYAMEQQDRLIRLGFLDLPAPVSADGFGRFKVSPDVLDPAAGDVLRVAAVDRPARGWRINGFSDIREQTGRVPDAVLFTIGDERTIIGYAEPTHMPLYYFMRQDFEFSDLNQPDLQKRNSWSGCIRSERLPTDRTEPVHVSVWAVNIENETVYRHARPFVLKPGENRNSSFDRPWCKPPGGIHFDDR